MMLKNGCSMSVSKMESTSRPSFASMSALRSGAAGVRRSACSRISRPIIALWSSDWPVVQLSARNVFSSVPSSSLTGYGTVSRLRCENAGCRSIFDGTGMRSKCERYSSSR